METNNKLREALENVTWLLESISEAFSKGTGGVYMSDVAESIANARAALASPPRNCDVGTPEEQNVRWRENCGRGIPNCFHCKVYDQAKESGLVNDRGLLRCRCDFVWAQMPYEEEYTSMVKKEKSRSECTKRQDM